MLKLEFQNFLDYLKGKNVLITTHDFVDIDGFTSCVVLKYFLNQYFKKQDVFLYFSKLSKFTTNFIENFNNKFSSFKFSYKTQIVASLIDVILILDANNLDQIQFLNKFGNLIHKIPYIYIDHHYNPSKNGKINDSSLNLIFDNFSSTSEIIYELFRSQDIPIKPPYKHLILAGILADSGCFKHGNNNTILRVSKLLTKDVNFQDMLLMLKRPEDISEKIAKIKGLKRVKIIRKGNWLLGISHVGSFEARVASTLTKIGFDVSIVYSENKSEFRISSRAGRMICLETQLHLGKIFREISYNFEGTGGGHIGAAAFNGRKNLKSVVNQIIEKIGEIINL